MELEELKKQAVEHQDNIELRSEKIRNIIGQMPPFLVRWGNTVLCLIFLFLLIAFFSIQVFL